MALLVFGFGSGLFLTVLLDDLLLWIRELKKLIRSQASQVEKVEEVESLASFAGLITCSWDFVGSGVDFGSGLQSSEHSVVQIGIGW